MTKYVGKLTLQRERGYFTILMFKSNRPDTDKIMDSSGTAQVQFEHMMNQEARTGLDRTQLLTATSPLMRTDFHSGCISLTSHQWLE